MKVLRVILLASAMGVSGVMLPSAAQQAAVSAPSPEAIAAAKELIALTSPDMLKDMNSKMLDQLWPAMEQALGPVSSKLDPSAAAELNAEVRAEFEKLMIAQWAELVDVMPAVYARYLTVDEIREIVAFYRSPTGAKTLKVMPQIMGETMGKFAPRFQDTMQQLYASLEGILQKHGYGPK